MIKFEYQAKNKSGELQVGFIEAENKDSAANRLYADNLYVLALTEVKKTGFRLFILGLFNKVSQKELMIFTRQFATLLESGVPLSDGLKTLIMQIRNSFFKEAIIEVQKEITAGLSLSQAMQKREDIFSDFYINMIRSAEATGRIDDVMGFLADFLEKQSALISKVRNALIYPIFMILFLIVVVIFMAVSVFPQIETIFLELGAELPALTRWIVAFGTFLLNWWWAVIISMTFLIFALRDYFKSKEGQIILDEIILRIPVFNLLLKYLYVARFADSISVLTKGGIAIVQAIEISARTIGSVIYRDILISVAEEVKNGVLLSQAIAKHHTYFPPLVSQMIAVGESTGKIHHLLYKVSTFYAREVEDLVSGLVELIQPILMLIIGTVVGVMFASMLMPIFNFISTAMN